MAPQGGGFYHTLSGSAPLLNSPSLHAAHCRQAASFSVKEKKLNLERQA